MTTEAAHPPMSLLRQLVLAWVPFCLGMTFTIVGAVIASDVPHARAQYSIWVALLLAAPALYMFARHFGRDELGPLWRLYWTFALAAYLFHLWYGYGVMFRGDMDAAIASQGLATFLVNVLVTILWIVDAIAAWTGWRGIAAAVIRAGAHAGVLAAGILSTLMFFRDDTAAMVGIALAAAAAIGLFQRLRTS